MSWAASPVMMEDVMGCLSCDDQTGFFGLTGGDFSEAAQIV
jgi:hypothetical protein